MNITTVYVLFIIVYALLIYLGFTLLEDSKILLKSKRKKINYTKKYLSFGVFVFLYVILIINIMYINYWIVIALLMYSTLLFFIMFSVKKYWIK
jgi:hypothetical protein